ncbi:hypothetical protein BDP81DRAFT_216567 [Colletotrichum phormii]|uniref:Uncharacterized protein n=1 Tax=Colletotrichum phormii TaxID=359342 RepID=A0AAJ0EHH9_9PEZI|nr:uncharacterized protein BDP81DRAFT_216567 [Colletotrichum phormii]KAK1636970.1 hypothetical protein BDP81DRAFT_216567 [Colletotrichum phormii]
MSLLQNAPKYLENPSSLPPVTYQEAGLNVPASCWAAIEQHVRWFPRGWLFFGDILLFTAPSILLTLGREVFVLGITLLRHASPRISDYHAGCHPSCAAVIFLPAGLPRLLALFVYTLIILMTNAGDDAQNCLKLTPELVQVDLIPPAWLRLGE